MNHYDCSVLMAEVFSVYRKFLMELRICTCYALRLNSAAEPISDLIETLEKKLEKTAQFNSHLDLKITVHEFLD